MKNNLKRIMLLLCAVSILCGCGSKTQSASAPQEEPVPAQEKLELVDVDLTTLSSTMVYSEVNNMVTNPDEYMGKKVKMNGSFAVYEGENRNYYACLIADATACCSQGIEFVWNGEHRYPQDYPELGSDITVTGYFDSYSEGDMVYYQLIDAEMTENG